MGQAQCPVCYTPLEVRTVAPCFVCGGSPEAVGWFRPTVEFCEWRLPSGPALVLCFMCELKEFRVRGGWGERLGLPVRRPHVKPLQLVHRLEEPQLGQDKFCPSCNLRLSFLDIVAECGAAGT